MNDKHKADASRETSVSSAIERASADGHATCTARTSEFDPFVATLVIRFGYVGTHFCGYAAQNESVRSVEGCLTRALSTFLRRNITLTCAGRTDAGVHAHAQYVSFPITQSELGMSKHKIMSALSGLCPDDISIRTLYRAPLDFSARFSARERSYTYRIALGPLKPILTHEFVWWVKNIPHVCMDDMNAAGEYLTGEHNFKSFCKASSAQLLEEQGLSLNRCLTSIKVSRDYIVGEQILRLDITGNAFLHNMVRIITASLLEVGRGARQPDWIQDVLRQQTRTAAAMTAPAQGLTLEHVGYPAGLLVPWSNE